MAAQELFEFSEHDLIYTKFDEEERCWTDTKDSDIWKDVTCMKLLHEGTLPDTVNLEECKRVRKRILKYHWHDQIFYFKRLFVRKPEDKMGLVIQMHEDLGHFGEEKTLVKSTRGTSSIIE